LSSFSERLRGAAASDRGRTLVAAVLVAIAAAALAEARVWESLDDFLFDAFTVVAASHPDSASPVVVVGIDEPSFSEVGLQWPWPRELHARLLDELMRAGATVVVFDIVFSEPSPPAGADAALARAIRNSGRVVLAGDVVPQETAHFRGLQRVEPLAAFREAGALTGIASIEVGRDQVVRQFPQDRESLWRVALDRHLQVEGKPRLPPAAPGPPARVRYSDSSDVGYVSYYQALEAGTLLPPEALRGKIALIGLVLKTSPEPGRKSTDTYATPFLRFTRLYAPGVELQGQFIAAAHAGRIVTPLAPGWTFALAALLLAASVAVMERWRAARAGLFTLGAGAAVAGASFILFDRANLWMPVSMPLGVLLGMFAGRGASAYVDELRRKHEIRRAFELYVAPAVVSEMTEHPEKLALGGQRKELTVMFTDLAGFTSLAEGMAPEEVAQLLNEHLTRMTRIVLRRRGTIDKFIGDSVMAFWGAPLDDAEHSRHAVQAAVEMQAEMRRWRDEPGGPKELCMRVGINTGEVVVGNLGSKARFDYTVIGDAVNLASRLESVNRLYGTPILLAESTARQASPAIPMRHVDRIRVKGKRDAIEVYTPHDDAQLVRETEAAIGAYRAREWQASAQLWRQILARFPGDGVATLYLARIESHIAQGVPDDWDATFDLDTK
jgi:adenylate cyclase